MKNDTESSMTKMRMMRFLMGLLLAIGLFLVEMGVAEILSSKDNRCLEMVASAKAGMGRRDECLTEIGRSSLMAMSRGPFAVFGKEASPAVAWFVTAVLYAILGGCFAQLSYKIGLGLFLGVHILIVVVLTFMGYISGFIV